MKSPRKRAKKRVVRNPQPKQAPKKTPLEITDNRQMIGWPGTLPPKRMGVLIHALETEEDPQGEQILIDLAMYIKAQECLRFSTEIPPTMQVMTPNLSGKVESFYYLELMTHAALMQDTAYTIGGIMSAIAPGGISENRMIFKLLRDPEWIGFNKTLPMLRGLNITISESREMPGHPGLVSAEPVEEGFPPGTTTDFPAGEAELLAQVMKWHGTKQVRWRPAHAEMERSSWYDR